MVKIFGMIAVFCATTLLGFSKSNECVRRIQYLKCMSNCVIRIENEIRYSQTPLKDIFFFCSKYENRVISKLFGSAYILLNTYSGETIEKVWKQAISQCECNISSEDIDLLNSLGTYLSNTDVDGQLKALNLFELNLKNAILGAEDYHSKNKKLYKWLGVYSGVIIILLFL